MNAKTRIGFFFIIPATLISVSAFVLWPSVIQGRSTANTPKQVVETFYQEYLDYIEEPGAENFRNPLVDRAYRSSELLTPGFKDHIYEILEKEEGLMADPFLCSQDIPREIGVQEIYQGGAQAQAVIRTDLSGHVFTADLRQEQDTWRIANVTCGGTPEGQAKAFYTWYLGAISNRTQGEFSSSLADRSYRDSQFLSSEFSAAVDDLLDKESKAGYDPFLLAQDIPSAFSVDPGLTEDSALVHLQFGKDSVKHLKVTFVRESGILLINCIAEDAR